MRFGHLKPFIFSLCSDFFPISLGQAGRNTQIESGCGRGSGAGAGSLKGTLDQHSDALFTAKSHRGASQLLVEIILVLKQPF